MTVVIEQKPKGCRLTDEQWVAYLRECTPGRLFFVAGNSIRSRVNHWFQCRVLKRARHELHVDHVGVIGAARGAYESLMSGGPTRAYFVDRYIMGGCKLYIGEWKPPFSEDEMDRGLERMITYLRSNVRRYDWVSLWTFGRLQKNDAMICSEFTQMYVDEALRMRPSHRFVRDCLVLPDELLDQVHITFSG